jgi:iron complex outermembrane recepter protein
VGSIMRNSVSLAVAAALVCGPAIAADSEPTTQLEEIVVTAERREMALQDTPISIIALSAETMEQKGIEDLQDLARFTPNLAIQGSRGTGNNQPSFIIRGISGGGGATGERGVALYIDGIYVPRTNGSVFKVFDLDRVEVLRGPQGTLFGRNSTGGAIRLVTKQPDKEFDSYLRGTFGNFDRKDFSGMVNLPVSDTVSVRAQAAFLEQDGYVRRATQMLGSSKDVLGRLQVAFTPSDAFKITFGALYSDSKSDGNPADFETFDMAPDLNFQGNYADWMSDALQAAGQPRLAVVDDPRIVLDDYTMPSFCLIDDFNPDWDKACEQRDDNRYTQFDANAQWTLGDNMSVSSITGVSKLVHRGNTDFQLLGFETRPDDVESRSVYQELQLNTALFGGKVDVVTGVNYFFERSHSRNFQLTRRGTSAFPTAQQLQNNPAATGVANGNGDAGLFTTADNDVNQEAKSYGWFNSATWHVNDKFNITGGARLAHDKKKLVQTRFRASDFTPLPGFNSTTVNADDKWTEIDWRVTFDYHFTDDLMAYTTASKAYRAGLYSATVLPNLQGLLQKVDPIDPEKVVSFESGIRATLFDGRLRINPTGYYMAWSNRQAARQVSCAAEGVVTCPVGFRINVVNSGDVDVWGLELDTQFAVLPNLTVDGALGITHYRLRDAVANSGPNLFPAQATPTWNIGATYSVPTPTAGKFSFNVNYASVGEQETHPTSGPDSNYLQPDYGLMNARLSWVSDGGNNSISLFANNLTDKTYGSYSTRFGGGFWDNGPGSGVVAAAPRSARSVVRGRPREIGITLQHNF